MFRFLDMMINNDYEQRKVCRDDCDWGYLSTAMVNDSDEKPYETGVYHPAYTDHVVILESYETKEQAINGHAKWLAFMESNPASITERGESEIIQLQKALGSDPYTVYPRKEAP